jgi:predicted DNA-binding transcriptional regulator AlpA
VSTDEFDIVDVADLQSILGIGRSRADTITRFKGFPEPVIDRPRYRAWRRADVEAWLDRNRPGWRGSE